MSFHHWGGPPPEDLDTRYWGIRGTDWEQFTRWDYLPEQLKSMATHVTYMGVDGSRWDLAGPHAGAQGVCLEKEFMGAMSVPFEHRWTEGPYVKGSIRERTDIRKRTISFGVVVNPNGNARAKVGGAVQSETMYRNTEARWNRAWSRTVHGWLGFFTRSTGWRWLKVILDSGDPGTLALDPVAFGNNMRQATVNAVAADPYAYKKAFVSKTVGFDVTSEKVPVQNEGTTFRPLDWLLHPEGETEMVYTTSVRLVNRGQDSSAPKYVVAGTGTCWIQDGVTDSMVRCPEIYSTDGYLMADTEETARTFTTSKEPVDNLFYRFARQIEILDYFPGLADLGDEGLPAWRRSNGARFQSEIPRETVTTIRFYHDNPNAKITALVPQKYETGW